MDLIYADETRKDIGVLNSYDLDMAYGKDENDFSCAVEARDHCCGKGYYIYAENTEYGGTVDRIRPNTAKGEIKYIGRTWHGVLESHVICPPEGEDYLILSGDANEILQEIFDRIGLSNLFVASTEESVEITNYQFDRYVYAYTGICKFLRDNDLKLHLSWQNSMIVASAEPIYDYSQDEEFDPSQVDFTIERNYRPVNHIICLGQGDLKDRKVIHIFTDENGGIQNYLQDPDISTEALLRIVKGPDFATGGIINIDEESLLQIYETGLGKLRVRGKVEVRDIGKGRKSICVTEIPVTMINSTEKFLNTVAELVRKGTLPAVPQTWPDVVMAGDAITYSFDTVPDADIYLLNVKTADGAVVLNYPLYESDAGVGTLDDTDSPLESGNIYYVSIEAFGMGYESAETEEHPVAVVDPGKVLTLPADLQMIVIPAGVTSVSDRAFAACQNLIAVVSPTLQPDATVFEDCPNQVIVTTGE